MWSRRFGLEAGSHEHAVPPQRDCEVAAETLDRAKPLRHRSQFRGVQYGATLLSATPDAKVATQWAAVAPWIGAQTSRLLGQRGHAWLLHGPSGLGQYELAMQLVRAWLCENPAPGGACSACTSCHAINVRTHADLFVLMPETVMLERGWPLSEKAQSELDEKKRKPSKEIRIEAMREAIEFSQRTSAWGRGKAVLLFPAERMNPVSANALLKTLEEPAGEVKLVLASEAAHSLMPTIRSRCLGHAMVWPDADQAIEWMVARNVGRETAQTLLRAAGGRPDDALRMAGSGHDPKTWALLPKAIQRGDLSLMQDWSPAEMVQVLHKLCHDLQLLGQGAIPRFFNARDLPKPTSQRVLSHWGRELARATRTTEHPFNPGLMREALMSQAKSALNSGH